MASTGDVVMGGFGNAETAAQGLGEKSSGLIVS